MKIYCLFIARKPFLRGFIEAMLDSWQKVFFLFQGKVKYFLKSEVYGKQIRSKTLSFNTPASFGLNDLEKDSLIFVFLTQEV